MYYESAKTIMSYETELGEHCKTLAAFMDMARNHALGSWSQCRPDSDLSWQKTLAQTYIQSEKCPETIRYFYDDAALRKTMSEFVGGLGEKLLGRLREPAHRACVQVLPSMHMRRLVLGSEYGTVMQWQEFLNKIRQEWSTHVHGPWKEDFMASRVGRKRNRILKGIVYGRQGQIDGMFN